MKKFHVKYNYKERHQQPLTRCLIQKLGIYFSCNFDQTRSGSNFLEGRNSTEDIVRIIFAPSTDMINPIYTTIIIDNNNESSIEKDLKLIFSLSYYNQLNN